jgi:hypothetical protein
MSKLKQLPALFILAITDAYLISHPNLLGKMGVLIFKYGMIKNFPNALITVMVTLGLSYGIAHVLELNFDKKWAKIALSAFTALSLIILIQVIFKWWIQVINATPAELFNFSAKTSLGVLNPNLFLGRLFKI